MRLSVRAFQKIFFCILCVWFVFFLKNVSNLSTIEKETTIQLPSLLFENAGVDDGGTNGDRGSLDARRRAKQNIAESIYGIEGRVRIPTGKTASTKIKDRRNVHPDGQSDLGGNAARDTRESRRNRNGTESFPARTTNASDTSIGNEKLLLKGSSDNDDGDDDFNGSKTRRRRGRAGERRRGMDQNQYGKSRFRGDDPSSPRVRKKPSLLLPTPIIVMGFPKAGTSSIFTFFQRQGLVSQHWYCCQSQTNPKKGGPTLMADCLLHNLKRNKSTSMFDGCGHFDVYSEINGPRRVKQDPFLDDRKGYLLDDGSIDFDGPGKRIFFPQHFRIQELHDAYPNATWILNWRDFDSWIESVLKWGRDDRLHDQFMNEYYMQGVLSSLPEKNTTATKEIMKKIYYDHHELVREFVQQHPSHTLVEVNITHENAGTVLAEAFGLNATAWKNINRNKKSFLTSLRATERKLFNGFHFIGSSLWWILLLVTMWHMMWTLGLERS